MILGKLLTGIWLVRFSFRPLSNITNRVRKSLSTIRLFCMPERTKKEKKKCAPVGASNQPNRASNVQNQDENTPPSRQDATTQSESQGFHETTQQSPSAFPPKPKSLYPPSILGLAMVARGEIGYLIASLAESQGIFGAGSSGGSSEIYLVVIWAISICTLVGPICVGTLVKRVKKLREIRGESGLDPLGVWGI